MSEPPTKRRRVLRFAIKAAIAVILLCLFAFGGVVFAWAKYASTLPTLRGWHLQAPKSEFRASDATASYSLNDYIAQENKVFAELDHFVNHEWASETVSRFCRFKADSICNPATILDRNWNRTYVLESPAPIGGALLVHGLSDSPYSLRALAEKLHAAGYTVVGLRVPGHGTCPKALADVEWPDWAAAVRIAVKGLRDRLPKGAPLIMVGYSNGGALCVHYTTKALLAGPAPGPGVSDARPLPDAIVLFSPMIGITPMAQFTELYPAVSKISGEKKLAWSSIETEIDPFKYSSWPTNASLQAYRVTQDLEEGLATLASDGRIKSFPPVLAVQSAADATVVPARLISVLMERLPANASELVLFDINHAAWLEGLTNNDFEQAIRPQLARPDLSFALTFVTNRKSTDAQVVARSRRGAVITESEVGVAWPRGIFSLSHLAVPIPPSDPTYGASDPESPARLPLGTLDLRGENGVLSISNSVLIRMRYNPFYAWTEAHVMEWLDARLKK